MSEVIQKFAAVKELPKLHPSFSEPALRYLIFNAKKNGLDKCLRKIGRKILINVSAFESWVDSHKQEAQ